MELRVSPLKGYSLALLVILLMVGGRAYFALGDFSYFFVAGSDFVNRAETPAPVWVNNGQGYDGQFFYRYALDPFDFAKTSNGVTVDWVPYRMQRIAYPMLTWVLSAGGTPQWVPFTLVLVNILLFMGIIFFMNAICSLVSHKKSFVLFPLLLCGLYMSMARSLSEITELFFFLGAVYYLFRNKWFPFIIFSTLAVLSRETALISLVPIVLMASVKQQDNFSRVKTLCLLIVPVTMFGVWKFIIDKNAGPLPDFPGGNNLGIPFKGMIAGLMGNLDVSTTKNILQLIFYSLYFLWQLFFILLVIHALRVNVPGTHSAWVSILTASWIAWLVFACCLSAAIYIDDWSFVRVFSLWNATGFLILFLKGRPLPRVFTTFAVVLAGITVLRMIVRA